MKIRTLRHAFAIALLAGPALAYTPMVGDPVRVIAGKWRGEVGTVLGCEPLGPQLGLSKTRVRFERRRDVTFFNSYTPRSERMEAGWTPCGAPENTQIEPRQPPRRP